MDKFYFFQSIDKVLHCKKGKQIISKFEQKVEIVKRRKIGISASNNLCVDLESKNTKINFDQDKEFESVKNCN